MILLVGGQKGGTGKTTIACNIAAWLAKHNLSVLLVDADTQGSASKWADMRGDNPKLPSIHCIAIKANMVKSVLQEANEKFDEVVIDAGGRDTKELRECLFCAHELITPVRGSQTDFLTLDEMQLLIREVEPYRTERLPARALLNFCANTWNARRREVAAKHVTTHYGFEVPFRVSDRVAFQDSMAIGQGVIDGNHAKAKKEIETLCQTIYCSDEAAAKEAC